MEAAKSRAHRGYRAVDATRVVEALRRLGSAPVRIDWFGDVVHSRRLASAARSIKVCCSIWGGPNHGSGDIQVLVPIAFLRLFRIGDVWQNGRRVGFDPDLQTVSFAGAVVDDSLCEPGPAGLPTVRFGGTARYDLPFSHFSAHRQHTGSFVARLEFDERTTVVVPSVELIRFYFGSSGGLLSTIFSGAFAERQLFGAARLNPLDGTAYLELGPGLPAVAAPTVARIAFDKIARREFRNLVNGGTAAKHVGDPFYPRMSFPFVGKTDLVADGTWLELDGGSRRVFVVARLLRCTKSFPFSALSFKLVDGTAGVMASKDSERESKAAGENMTAGPLVEADTKPGLGSISVRDPMESGLAPFPDLLSKSIRRMKGASPGTKVAPKESEGQLGVQPGSGGTGRAAEVTQSVTAALVGTGEEILNLLRDEVVSCLCGEVKAHLPERVPHSGPLIRDPSWFLRIHRLDSLMEVIVLAPSEFKGHGQCIIVARPDNGSGTYADMLGTFDRAARGSNTALPQGATSIEWSSIRIKESRRKCPLVKATLNLLA